MKKRSTLILMGYVVGLLGFLLGFLLRFAFHFDFQSDIVVVCIGIGSCALLGTSICKIVADKKNSLK